VASPVGPKHRTWRQYAGPAAVAVIGILVVGFILRPWLLAVGMGRGLNPLPALARLDPDGVGVVVRAEPVPDSCDKTRVTLDTGATLELQLSRVRCGDWPWSWKSPTRNLSEAGVFEGGVLYYGHDWLGSPWIAGTYPQPRASSCPYVLKGQGYDEGDILHLTSGLVVQKAPGFSATPWVEDPTVIHTADDICVDREGRATSLSIFAPY
jgi:hypothetical protein